jgi:hypothetical protein
MMILRSLLRFKAPAPFARPITQVRVSEARCAHGTRFFKNPIYHRPTSMYV